MEQPDFFKHFQRQKTFEKKVKTYPKVFFQIGFERFGATLTTVDAKGNSIDPNYLSYGGTTRNILHAMDQIQNKNSFVIDWEKPSGKIFLSEQEHLVDLLQRADNVVDTQMQVICYKKGEGKIKIQLTALPLAEGENDPELFWKSAVQLFLGETIYKSFELLNEETALIHSGTSGDRQQILKVQPVGEGFRNLTYFDTEVSNKNLPVFFSLLFSYLENVELLFEDYTLEITEDKIFAKPSLIFEKTDTDNALFMRVGQTLPHFEIGVLEQFDLFRYAEINDLEKRISIKYIEQEPTQMVIKHITKLLKKHTPKNKKEEREDIVVEDDLFIIPFEVASSFIYDELPKLLIDYQIFGSEKLKLYKVTAIKPTININLTHEIDFMEGDVDLVFGNEKMSLFDAFFQFRKNHYIQLNDGTHALISEDYIKKLERIFQKEGNQVKVSIFDLPLVEELIDEKVNDDALKKPREIFEGFNDLAEKKYPLPELNAILRPYQNNGFTWIKYLYENKLGGCLADDMGLGKTLQTIAILATIYPQEEVPSIIVMPRSLLFNWKAEVKKFAPQISTYTYYGIDRNLEEAKKANLIFTTYTLIRNDIELLKDEIFHYAILDESQNIKNIQAQTTKAVMLLQSERRLALSGTPIENNLGELYSLFRFLNPNMFGTLNQFNKNYLTPIQKYNDKNAIRQLRQKIYPFILRRLKRDVLDDLPDKIEQTIYVEMSDAQEKLYEKRRAFYKDAVQSSIATRGMQQSRFFIFQALSELRQIASSPENFSKGKIISPKRELLQTQLADSLANGHKVLVFVNFLAAIELIGNELQEMGVDYVSITGATRNRQGVVQRFQTDPNCKVFLMTLKTGGTGLNLTAADTIFIFDPWWNAAAENQAIDRAYRIGQQNKVHAYKLITEGTIEEKIVKLQEAKKELFDNIISTDSGSLKSLSEEDIDFIFS